MFLFTLACFTGVSIVAIFVAYTVAAKKKKQGKKKASRTVVPEEVIDRVAETAMGESAAAANGSRKREFSGGERWGKKAKK